MTVYCVSYDLNKTGQNYNAIHEELKRSPAWCHLLDSTWLVSTNETGQQLNDRLVHQVDKNDRLLVVKVTSPHFQGWLSDDAWTWIYQHVTA